MTTADAPSDRPPFSAPPAVYPVVVLLYLAQGSIPALLLMVCGSVLQPPRDLLGGQLLLYVLVVGGWLVALIVGLRNGRLWAVRAVRWTAGLLGLSTIAGLGVSLLLTLGAAGDGGRETMLLGRFGLGGFVICLLVLVVLWRRLGRVKWLDPQARPDQWEPPARRMKTPATKR